MELMKKIILLVFVLMANNAYARMVETTWTPDTCTNCTVTYEWDDSVPAEERVHTFKRIDRASPDHPGLSGVAQYNAILNENQRKNKAEGQLKTISNMIDTAADGTVTFKNGITVNYTWTGTDADRVLNIQVVGYNLTTQQRNSVQTWCNTNLGVGKVVIQ